MKTIAIKDRANPNKILFGFNKEGLTRHERIHTALQELQHVGNVDVFLIKGNKTRFLFTKKL